MGLGVLFFGYVLLSFFSFTPMVGFLIDLIGTFVIFEAINKLKRHARKFRYAAIAVYVMFFVSVIRCVYYGAVSLQFIEDREILTTSIEAVRLTALFILTVTVLLSLSELALSVGDLKLADKGKRNAWLYTVSNVFMILMMLEFDFLADFRDAFSAFSMVFWLLCVLLNCIYIYSCYMWICLEGDHDMTRPSGLDRFFGKLMPKKKELPPDDPAYEKAKAAADNRKKK